MKRYVARRMCGGKWYVIDNKAGKSINLDGMDSKQKAEEIAATMNEDDVPEENVLSWSTNFFIVEDKHRKSFLIKRISDKKEVDYCDTLDIAERRVLNYEGQIRKNEGETIDEFKEKFWIDEKFLIRTKASLTWNSSEWICVMPPGKYKALTGTGQTPSEAIEMCKGILIAARDELNQLITG
jgi:hypothetical protein